MNRQNPKICGKLVLKNTILLFEYKYIYSVKRFKKTIHCTDTNRPTREKMGMRYFIDLKVIHAEQSHT